jgi:thioredoxin 1
VLAELESDKFDNVIGRTGKMVLVDFWAEWCGYCHVMDPIVQDAASKYHDKIEAFRMNADENVEITNRLGIAGLPVFMLFSEGKPVCSLLGATTREKFESWIEDCLRQNLSNLH